MAKGAPKMVYFFGNGKAEGRRDQKELLGGKGAGLAEMTNIGLPVPAGFTITTDCCAESQRNKGKWPRGLDAEVKASLSKLERACRKKFGDPKNPLLVSVRSGAAASMPGMMETILNLGLNDRSVEGLANVSSNPRFALDAYRRFIMMYGATAEGMDRAVFDDAFDNLKDQYTRARIGAPSGTKILDNDVNEEELQSLIHTYKELYQQHTGSKFPQDPYKQLVGAINAVFGSWISEKATTYRRVEKITGLNGTAVNIQQMVFGNMGDDSGTGVCFTRDPSTGENVFYGDLLINAQGEDVVAGVRTPIKLIELKRLMPESYDQLEAVRIMLELHYQDMQDLEFTIERGKLYMLQCRTGKRSPAAAFRIAVDQATRSLVSKAQAERLAKKKYLPKSYVQRASQPVISQEQAIQRISERDIERLFYPVIDGDVPADRLQSSLLGTGINAVPGAACGKIVLSASRAEEAAACGEDVILVRKETSPEDVGGMHAAKGILTATGGKTSHAAVVARSWGKCCIVGCEQMRVDYQQRTVTFGNQTLQEGEIITLDGAEGEIYAAQLPLVMPEMPAEYHTLLGWCDRRRRLRVRTNADTPADARRAVELGAQGIGLCRTEHMFFETEERRLAMQEMILSDTTERRRAALDKLRPFQRDDFVEIFRAMDGYPVTIRLIDPPLHEFLPHSADDIRHLSYAISVPVEDIERRAEQLHESNPMLGHRGCRLCITFPEVLEMQVSAIVEAAIACKAEGIRVFPEIMIPLSIDARELEILSDQTRSVANRLIKESGSRLKYLVGTMIETPRAALLGDLIGDVADFFSFGTNDLTQTTMALSRDDAGRFLPDYVDESKAAIFTADPFTSIDVAGVGQLIRWGIERGRQSKADLKIGICGEHGGDPESVQFCHEVGMDYVSCSPYRVPIARLAAASAMISEQESRKAPARRAAAKRKPRKKAVKAAASRTSAKKKTKKKTPRKAAARKASRSSTKKTSGKAKRKTTASKKKVGKAKRTRR